MSVKIPSTQRFLTELKRRQRTSYDFLWFKYWKGVPLFVYDDFRYGGKYWRQYLKEAQWLGRGCTALDCFVMHEVQSTARNGVRSVSPFVHKDEKSEDRAVITGDVFLVSPEHLLVMDYEHAEDNFLYRQRHKIYFLDQDRDKNSKGLKSIFNKPYYDMYMYLMLKTDWDQFNCDSKLSEKCIPDSYTNSTHRLKAWDKPFYEYITDDMLTERSSKEKGPESYDDWYENYIQYGGWGRQGTPF